MNIALIAFIWGYQKFWCKCVSPDSCCRKGLTNARTLSFLSAVKACWIGYGECRESTHS